MGHAEAELHQAHRGIIGAGGHRHLSVAFDDLSGKLLLQLHNHLRTDGASALGGVFGAGKAAAQGAAYRGDDIITGFNFEIDLAVWDHQVFLEKDRFFIGILRPDGVRHSYHGVHRNGNAGTLLYVHGSPAGTYREGPDCLTIADLTERFIQAEITFDQALALVQTRRIVYAPDATMQAMLSDRQGRVLIVEPGIGWRAEYAPYSLMANASLLDPASTAPFAVPGDDRYQRAEQLLKGSSAGFSARDGLALLEEVHQEGIWATRVSFVYSVREQAVYYTENNRFDRIQAYRFPDGPGLPSSLTV